MRENKPGTIHVGESLEQEIRIRTELTENRRGRATLMSPLFEVVYSSSGTGGNFRDLTGPAKTKIIFVYYLLKIEKNRYFFTIFCVLGENLGFGD